MSEGASTLVRILLLSTMLLLGMGLRNYSNAQGLVQLPSIDEIAVAGALNSVPLPQSSIPLLVRPSQFPYYPGPTMSTDLTSSEAEEAESERSKSDVDVDLDIGKDMAMGQYFYDPAADIFKDVIIGEDKLGAEAFSEAESWAEVYKTIIEWGFSGDFPGADIFLKTLGIGGSAALIVGGLLSPSDIAPDQFTVNPPYAGMPYGPGSGGIPTEQLPASCDPGVPGCEIPGPPAPAPCQPGDSDCQLSGPPSACDADCQCARDPDCVDPPK